MAHQVVICCHIHYMSDNIKCNARQVARAVRFAAIDVSTEAV